MHEILGFIWPIMAASAEGMLFFLMIVILAIIGRGKILPSEQAIIIDRTGRYKMELAPGLNLAQAFIEAIAEQVTSREDIKQNEFMLNFKVQDKNISSRKRPFYLLQVSVQNGNLSFYAKPALQDIIHPNTSSFESDEWTMPDDIAKTALHECLAQGVNQALSGFVEIPLQVADQMRIRIKVATDSHFKVATPPQDNPDASGHRSRPSASASPKLPVA